MRSTVGGFGGVEKVDVCQCAARSHRKPRVRDHWQQYFLEIVLRYLRIDRNGDFVRVHVQSKVANAPVMLKL